MTRMTRRTAVIAGLATFAVGGAAQAAKPVSYTTIHVHNMHCENCAKRIAGKLYGVPGVIEVRADVPKNIAYVVPKKDKALSPKSLWEAVEASGFKVAKLEGPEGSFTAKPTR